MRFGEGVLEEKEMKYDYGIGNCLWWVLFMVLLTRKFALVWSDIIAMITRDAVFMSGGGRYTVSLAKLVNLPRPFISISDSIKAFAQKGLNAVDMVYLLGAYTVGITCSLVKDRLYNFQNSGQPDKTMSPLLLFSLRSRCPQNATVDNVVNLDPKPFSTMTVDNSLYRQIKKNRGILQIDQQLALDPLTKDLVTRIANGFYFSTKFGQALVKLGAVPSPHWKSRRN
ncbi:hypothetical protein ACH5RR_021149 [Cinchona calisaya]|uniref:peroxidase n=1 Tax=Cinchona calisaya TaxID=153742 RepID=A0ABD2ZJR7_9GENT